MIRFLSALVLSLTISMGTALAATLPPEELLDDPALEERARDLAAELRCVVCPNQSIADSEATLSLDMQRFIRRELASGASDQAIVDALIDRYGERVLLNPPITTRTYLLWGLPAFLSLLVLAVLWRRRKSQPLEPLPIDDWSGETVENTSSAGDQRGAG